jgi:hypothetical protein
MKSLVVIAGMAVPNLYLVKLQRPSCLVSFGSTPACIKKRNKLSCMVWGLHVLYGMGHALLFCMHELEK